MKRARVKHHDAMSLDLWSYSVSRKHDRFTLLPKVLLSEQSLLGFGDNSRERPSNY